MQKKINDSVLFYYQFDDSLEQVEYFYTEVIIKSKKCILNLDSIFRQYNARIISNFDSVNNSTNKFFVKNMNYDTFECYIEKDTFKTILFITYKYPISNQYIIW
jgi:hypothetical protein